MCRFTSVQPPRIVFPVRHKACLCGHWGFTCEYHNCWCIVINRDQSDRSPKNEGTLVQRCWKLQLRRLFLVSSFFTFDFNRGVYFWSYLSYSWRYFLERAFSQPRELFIYSSLIKRRRSDFKKKKTLAWTFGRNIAMVISHAIFLTKACIQMHLNGRYFCQTLSFELVARSFSDARSIVKNLRKLANLRNQLWS